MNPTPPALRKASILIASLEPQQSANILQEMNPDQRRAIEKAIESLGPIDPTEQARVIEEFFRIGPSSAENRLRGVELELRSSSRDAAADFGIEARSPSKSFVPDALDAYTAINVHAADEFNDLTVGSVIGDSTLSVARESPDNRVGMRRPFEAMQEWDGRQLAAALAGERPSTIAVVALHLPPERAASVLSFLSAPTQAAVARQLVELDAATPEIVQEIERGLEARLSKLELSAKRAAGLGALRSILAAADEATRALILQNLRLHDRRLALNVGEQPAPRTLSREAGASQRASDRSRGVTAQRSLDAPAGGSNYDGARSGPRSPGQTSKATTRLVAIKFADLERFDDDALDTVVHSADTEVLVLALAGASMSLAERVLRQLPSPEARALRYAIDHLGPTRLADVEEAQRRIAVLAAELHRDGRVGRGGNRSLSIAV